MGYNSIARWLKPLAALLLAFSAVAATGERSGHDPEGGRRWVKLLLEDHGGMREVVWDAAFPGPGHPVAGPFMADHRYGLVTGDTPGLVNLGCWDSAWPKGNGWKASNPVALTSWAADHKGVVLSLRGHQTWIPLIAPYGGKGAPSATYQGAYLNWLLQNRGNSPSIPSETRWHRLQRGALAVARRLMTGSRSEDDEKHEFRLIGIGTSGRQLVPPAGSLRAVEHAIQTMTPSRGRGFMAEALKEALEQVSHHSDNDGDDEDDDGHSSKGCQPGIVFAISDGNSAWGQCGGSKLFETFGGYGAMLRCVLAIQGTGKAEVWAWSLEGPRSWSNAFAAQGSGHAFAGDAVEGVANAISIWRSPQGASFQLALSFDQPALTREAKAVLTVASSHGLRSATLNGQIIQLAGLRTQIPVVLQEGINPFLVTAIDICGSQGLANASITLDTTPPKITLNATVPAVSYTSPLLMAGQVDDPAAQLIMNREAVTLDAQGKFALQSSLAEGGNIFAFVATDAAGNQGFLNASTEKWTVAVGIAPAKVTVTTGGTQTFAPTIVGTDNPSVTWGASGGTVSPTGVYTAPSTPGTYTVSVRSTVDPTKSAFAEVTVLAPPTISTFTKSTTITLGQSAMLKPVFTDGAGVLDQNLGPVSTGTEITVSPTTTTTYTLTVTNPAGTSISAQVTVTVVAAPNILSFIADPASILLGGNANLIATFSGGTAVIDQGIGAITSGTAVSTGPLPASNTYTLTVTNAAATVAIATVMVSVEIPPDTAITAPPMVTAGQRGYPASVPSGIPGQTYFWSITNGEITSTRYASSVMFKAGSSGSPVGLSCQVLRVNGSIQASSSLLIPVIDAPDSKITSPLSVVVGDTGMIASVPAVAGSTYAWGIQGGTITSSSTGASVIFDAPPLKLGPIALECTVTNAAGTSDRGKSAVDVQSQIGDVTGVYVDKNFVPTLGSSYQVVLVQSGDQIFGWGTYLPAQTTATPGPLPIVAQTQGPTLDSNNRTGRNWLIGPFDYYSFSGTIANGVIKVTAWDFAGSQLKYFTWPLSTDGQSIEIGNGGDIRYRLPGAVAVIFRTPRLLLKASASQHLVPTVIGTSNPKVSWEIQGAPGESISDDGTYIAPDSPGLYAVTARSIADPNQSATTFVRVTSDGNLDLGAGSSVWQWGFQHSVTFTTGNHLLIDSKGSDYLTRMDGTVSGLYYSGTWEAFLGSTSLGAMGSFKYIYDPVTLSFLGYSEPASSAFQQRITFGTMAQISGTGTQNPTITPLQIRAVNADFSTEWVPYWIPYPSGPPSIWYSSFGVVQSVGASDALYSPSLKPGLSLVTVSPSTLPTLVQGVVCINLVNRAVIDYSGVYGTTSGEIVVAPDSTFRWANAAFDGVATGSVYPVDYSGRILAGRWTAGAMNGTLEMVLDSARESFRGYWKTATDLLQEEWQGSLVQGAVRVSLSARTSILNTGGEAWLTAGVTGAADCGLIWSTTGGSISSNGHYQAPEKPGTYVIAVVSQADSTQTAQWTFKVIDYPLFTNLSGAYGDGGTVLFQDGLNVRILNFYSDPISAGYFILNGDHLVDQHNNEYAISADGNTLLFNPRTNGNSLTRVTQTKPVVAITPEFAKVLPGQAIQMKVLSAGGEVSFSAIYGTIDSNGLYTAPLFPIRDTVTAVIPGTYHTGSYPAKTTIDVVGSNNVDAQGSYISYSSPTQTLVITAVGAILTGSINMNEFGYPVVLTGPLDKTNWTGTWFVPGDPVRQGTFKAYIHPTADSIQLFTFNPTGPVGFGALFNRASGGPSLYISPDAPTLPVGSYIRFTWTPAPGKNIPNVSWSVTEANGGTIDADGTYTAPAIPGIYTVVARSTTNSTWFGQTKVSVQSAITISPTSISIPSGSSAKFGYSLFAPTNRVIWSASGGSIAPDGIYTAPLVPGIYTVTVTSVDNPTVFASATVSVMTPTVTLTITPPSLTLSCGAKATLGYGIQVTGSSDTFVSWSATGGSLNVLGTSQVEYTAPASPGTYLVTVQSQADPQVTAIATVTVVPVEISINPPAITLAPGDVIQFGGSIRIQGSGTTEVEWGTSEGILATVGPLSVRYTAPDHPGTYQVTIKSKLDPNATAIAICTVESSLAPMLTLIPNTLWLPPGGQRTFTAQHQGQVVSDVLWFVDDPSEGTIDQQGLYTAPMAPGRYQVKGEDRIRQLIATANISVGQLSVSPSSSQILPGAQMQFTALAGSTLPTNPTWSIQEGSLGGSIDSIGLYTAPAAPGVYHILVTSDQGAGTTSVVVGLIDAIAISPTLQIEEAGDYVVAITLEGSNGKQLRQARRFTLAVGTAQPEIMVSAELIRRDIGVDGPYALKKVELQREGADDSYTTDTKQDLGSTAAYPIANFQRPWVVFDPDPGVMGLDSNGNGLVDQLKVTVSVEVVAGGNYNFSAVLADMDYREVVVVTQNSVLLNPGKNQFVLTLDGKAIRARGIEGPYQITGISLSGSVTAVGPDIGPINFVLAQFEP